MRKAQVADWVGMRVALGWLSGGVDTKADGCMITKSHLENRRGMHSRQGEQHTCGSEARESTVRFWYCE
jgi:hypothetical protein